VVGEITTERIAEFSGRIAEHVAVASVTHGRSYSPSSCRAMMLRWISLDPA
jgi:hypothetical protein